MIRRSGGDTPRSAASSTPSFAATSRGKKIWTAEEDENLKNLVSTYGTGNWTLVAQSLPDRTGKQCRERWHNHLGSGIKKGDWTEEEDRIIITMQRHIGNQWAKITKMLPGRTDNAVKNRFHATERAKSRGKCDESLYNTALDEAYFEQLKRQHTDIDFDTLCEQHTNAVAQGTADGSSVDNTRTSSITGSDASSTRGRARLNGAAMALDSYMDDGQDEALSEEDEDDEDEEDDQHAHGTGPHEEYLGANLADVGRLEDSEEADPMHLMDIDIISFDSDDMNLDFDAADGMHQQDTRNPAGDSCCFSFFDWGCSTYYKNVFNPATDKRNVGLPGSSAQANQPRPQTFKKEPSGQSTSSSQQQTGNFYNLPPAPTTAIELHPIGTGNGVAAPPAPSGPTPLQLAAQAAQASTHGAPTPTPQQQQQAQLMYATLPMAPTTQPMTAVQYQQFLAHQQMQLQQQQQQFLAYQAAMTPQQQQHFQQFQQQQQLQMQQYLQQQQQQFQQAQMMQQGGFPQQYAMHAQYAMQQQQQQQQQQQANGRPLSTGSYGSAAGAVPAGGIGSGGGGSAANSRPVSSSSYGGSSY